MGYKASYDSSKLFEAFLIMQQAQQAALKDLQQF